MRADVPVGAFLSGGVDSTIVVSLMARLTGHKVHALTVSHPQDPQNDESEYARAVAKRVGADLQVLEISEAEALRAFPQCARHLDEPIPDPACINTFLGSRELRSSGVLVALVGEGADELFLGYPYYIRHSRLDYVHKVIQHLPHALRATLSPAAEKLADVLGYSVHRDLVRRLFSGEGLFLSSEPFFPDCDKLALSGPELKAIVRAQPSAAVTQTVLEDFQDALGNDVLAQMSLAESRMRMPEKLLMRVDKLSMAHSIEVRAPFLNRHLARYALSLPGHVRTLGGQPKGLLKAAVTDLVPSEVLNRPKHGFSTPVKAWFQGSFGQLLEQRLGSEIFTGGLLNADTVRSLLKQHREGRSSHHTKLWNILCLTEWYEQFGISDVADNGEEAKRFGQALVC
jgi:asparagine synthase (glutamine-hydrolysing)